MISAPASDHLVGGVGAVEQLADHLLVPRVGGRQQLPQPLEHPGAGRAATVSMPGASFSWPAARRASAAGARSPADVDTRATPRTRSPNSSGRAAARHMIVMPPIECPPRTTGPGGRQLVEHLAEVVAELVDAELGRRRRTGPRWSGRARAGRSGSGAARPAAIRGASSVGDVVPRGLGQRPAVGEDEGDRGVVRSRRRRRAARRRRRCGRRRPAPLDDGLAGLRSCRHLAVAVAPAGTPT